MYEPNYISILNSIFPHIYFHLIICNLLCLYLYKSLRWIIFYSQKRNARGTDTRRRTAVSGSCWGERWKYVSFNLYFIHVMCFKWFRNLVFMQILQFWISFYIQHLEKWLLCFLHWFRPIFLCGILNGCCRIKMFIKSASTVMVFNKSEGQNSLFPL